MTTRQEQIDTCVEHVTEETARLLAEHSSAVKSG